MKKAIIPFFLMIFLFPLVNAALYTDDFEDGDISDWTERTDGLMTGVNKGLISSGQISGSYSLRVYDDGSAVNIGGIYSSIGESLNENFTYSIELTINDKNNPITNSNIYFDLGDAVTTGATNRGHLFFLFNGDIYYWTALGTSKDSGYNYNYNTDYTLKYVFTPADESCELYLDGTRIDTGDCFHDNYAYINPKLQFNDFASSKFINAYVDDISFNVLGEQAISITAKNNITTNSINTFTSSLYDEDQNLIFTNSTTSGLINFNMTEQDNGNYTITFASDGYKSLSTVIEYLNETILYEFGTVPTPSIDISFYDEDTGNLITGITMFAEIIGNTETFNANTTTGEIFEQLGSDNSYIIKYFGSGYLTKYYALNIESTESISVSLYATNSSTSYQNITATITDQNLYPLEDAILSIEKFNQNAAQYVVSERIIADFEGKAIFKGTLYDEFYKFRIYYDDELVFTSTPTTIKSTELNFIVNIGDAIGQDYFDLLNLDYDLYFQNSTNRFVFSYSNNLGSITGLKLETVKIGVRQDTIINTTTTTAASGTIYHPISNQTGFSYKSCAYGLVSGEYKLINCETKSYKQTIQDGSEDLFLFALALLTVLFALTGIYSISLMLVVTPIPAIIFEIIGFTTIGLPIVLSIEILFIIIALAIDKN